MIIGDAVAHNSLQIRRALNALLADDMHFRKRAKTKGWFGNSFCIFICKPFKNDFFYIEQRICPESAFG